MNVFEDLVVELQEENLLETTNTRAFRAEPVLPAKAEDFDLNEFSEDDDTISEPSAAVSEAPQPVKESIDEPVTEAVVNDVPAADEPYSPPPLAKPNHNKEFYQKRAVGEISNLQMVEHVLTGVEREYLKIVPQTFDDFNVKKSLNAFMRVDENPNSAVHQESEFTLMQETEAWCTALAERDHKIPVSCLRQYCENSSPALSSQAMLALARFYRNLPYSEAVRSKFDFIITRLFSRPIENKRVCLFTPDETLTHINKLYRDWSSISLYAVDDDDSKVVLAALSFDDLAKEAAGARDFDTLISRDFFGRLRSFKESINELFYAPNVTAAAIDANIKIGNVYVELINRERQKMNAASIQAKYGELDGDNISEATGRSLDLVDLLRARNEEPVAVEPVQVEPEAELPTRPAPSEVVEEKPKKEKRPRPAFVGNFIENALNINKWFLGFAILLIAASFGIYVWANYIVSPDVPSPDVKAISLENTGLEEVVKVAKVSGEMMYILLKPEWNDLPKEKRQDYLQKAFKAASQLNCKQVSLLTHDGKPAGFASATRSEVVMQ